MTRSESARPVLFSTFLVVAALTLNLVLSIVNTALSLPFFLDSIGTAIVAATAGLLPALIVAIGTNALFEIAYGFNLTHFPFALCGIATAVIVRAFVRTGRFQTAGHMVVASLAVAAANAILGSIVASYLYGGVTGVGIDFLVAGLVASGQSLFSASFWARVPANIIDKSIAIFAAYFAQAPLLRLADRLSGESLIPTRR